MVEKTNSFLQNLYEEKLAHKQHRHEFVKQKLLFTIALFSLGSLKTLTIAEIGLNIVELLYFVPIVALSFDVYIFSEDFKVKRIGKFILQRCKNIRAPEEENWERWLKYPKHRERLALFSSLLLTVIVLIASLIVIDIKNNTMMAFWWFLLSALLITLSFSTAIYIRNQLLKPDMSFPNNKLLIVYLLIFVVLASLLLSFFSSITWIRIFFLTTKWGIFLFSLVSSLLLLLILRVVFEVLRRIWRKTTKYKFILPATFNPMGNQISIVGEFNNWEKDKHIMQRNINGDFELIVEDLEIGREYEYKLFVEGKGYIEDPFALYTTRDPFGGENSVLHI